MVGAQVRTPPLNSLPNYKVAGETSAQRYWLYEEAEEADILIVSLETLTLGGVLPALGSNETLETVLRRLEVLRELRRRHPHLKIFAYGTLLHVSQDGYHQSALEQPYFAEWGDQLRAYSVAADRHSRYGQAEQAALDAAREALPPEVLRDWLTVRERHLQLHLHALNMVQGGVIDRLSLTLESSEVYGLDAVERRLLEERTDQMQLWPQVDIYPGGGEVVCTLMARALETRRQLVWVRYSGAYGGSTELLNADRVTAEVLLAQLRAANCMLASSVQEADFVLLVNTPGVRQGLVQPNHTTVDTVQRNLPAFVDNLQDYLNHDKPVVLADIAYLGGAEQRLWNMMQHLPLAGLSGYAAWGTAGSSLGTAIAFGKLSRRITVPDIHRSALFARLVSDGLYQTSVRPQLEDRFAGANPEASRFAAEKVLQPLLSGAVQHLWQRLYTSTTQLYLHAGVSALAWPQLHSGVALTYTLSPEEPPIPEAVEAILTQPNTTEGERVTTDTDEGQDTKAGAPTNSVLDNGAENTV